MWKYEETPSRGVATKGIYPLFIIKTSKIFERHGDLKGYYNGRKIYVHPPMIICKSAHSLKYSCSFVNTPLCKNKSKYLCNSKVTLKFICLFAFCGVLDVFEDILLTFLESLCNQLHYNLVRCPSIMLYLVLAAVTLASWGSAFKGADRRLSSLKSSQNLKMKELMWHLPKEEKRISSVVIEILSFRKKNLTTLY